MSRLRPRRATCHGRGAARSQTHPRTRRRPRRPAGRPRSSHRDASCPRTARRPRRRACPCPRTCQPASRPRTRSRRRTRTGLAHRAATRRSRPRTRRRALSSECRARTERLAPTGPLARHHSHPAAVRPGRSAHRGATRPCTRRAYRRRPSSAARRTRAAHHATMRPRTPGPRAHTCTRPARAARPQPTSRDNGRHSPSAPRRGRVARGVLCRLAAVRSSVRLPRARPRTRCACALLRPRLLGRARQRRSQQQLPQRPQRMRPQPRRSQQWRGSAQRRPALADRQWRGRAGRDRPCVPRV